MAFIQSFTAVQSGDGLSVIITDTSNWADNSLNPANFVRQFVIRNSLGTIIGTYAMPTNASTLSYPIAVNQWQAITYNITGAFSLSLLQEYPFEQIFRLADAKAIALLCGACCDNNISCSVNDYYRGAQYAIPIGNGIAYDANINAAYHLLVG